MLFHTTQGRWLLVATIAMAVTTMAYTQPEDDTWHYGFKGGVNYSMIGDIQSTIIPSVFAVQTYSASEERRLGYTAGFFLYQRFRNSSFAIQPQVSFSARGGDFSYSDIEDLDYTIGFNYQYVDISVLMKVYPAAGFHFAAGPEIGFQVASTNINYTSNMPELGPDLQIQQSLREVLKGKNDFGFLLGIGYDFDFGLMLEVQYRFGITDVIETQANGFNFIENTNRSSSVQFTAGYAIPFWN